VIAPGIVRAVAAACIAHGTAVAGAVTSEASPLATTIASQPVEQALEQYEQLTGLHVVYVSKDIAGKIAQPAEAGLAPRVALEHLLAGTQLEFEFLNAYTVRVLAKLPRVTAVAAPPADALVEVIVTANRRVERLNDSPVTVIVLTAEELVRQHVSNFDDYLALVPGLTAHTFGPGESNLIVRGLATNSGDVQGTIITGLLPTVAIYIDDEPVGQINHNVDLYAADLERVEVLEGPQGTLFGAGAEAGVVRYITRKPRLDLTEVHAQAGTSLTEHGAPSHLLTLTANLPLLSDRLAMRAVLYREHRGGYIDNIHGTFAREPTDLGIRELYGGQVPPNSVVLDNSALVARDINSAEYVGGRLQFRYHISNDWEALVSQVYQTIDTEGVFAQMSSTSDGQPLPGLAVQLFNAPFAKDRFQSTTLTLEGRLGALKAIYSGSYRDRRLEQQQDYTNYSRALYASFYQCAVTAWGDLPTQCFTPSATWHDQEKNSDQSHELRVMLPEEGRLRGVGGAYFERELMQGVTDFYYASATPYFNPLQPPKGYWTVNGLPLDAQGRPISYTDAGAVFVPVPPTLINPHPRGPTDSWINDITHTYAQQALFASLDYDLIPGKLTLTAGTRYSRVSVREVGATTGIFSCQIYLNPPSSEPCGSLQFIDLDTQYLQRTFKLFSSRLNLSWKPHDGLMVYYTFSQGFRAGGFNRFTSVFTASPLSDGPYPWQAQAQAHANGSWRVPQAYQPDRLSNNEIGLKLRRPDGRAELQTTLFQEDWLHVQTSSFEPLVMGGLVFNGGNYRARGLALSAAWRSTGGLTLESSAVWNSTALVRKPPLYWGNGTPINLASLQNPDGLQLPSGMQTLGTSLAGAPPLQLKLLAHYEHPWRAHQLYLQGKFTHQSHSLSAIGLPTFDLVGNSTSYDLPAFSTAGAAVGVRGETWSAELYGENIGDTRAQLYANYGQFYKAVTVNRPRTIGLRLSWDMNPLP
jgi:outer membrane receptor protein involved in Fe transport